MIGGHGRRPMLVLGYPRATEGRAMKSRWTELADGPRARIREMGDILDSLDPGTDPEQSAELERLGRVLNAIDERFGGRRAELMATNTIQEVNTFLARAVDAARQNADQVATGSPLNLVPVNDLVDQAIRALAGSPVPTPLPRAVLDAASEFDEEATAIVGRLQERAQQVEARMGSLRADAEQAVTAARDGMAAAQDESRQATEENAQKLAELQTRVDTMIDTQQGVFSKALENQRGEFGALLKTVEEQADNRAEAEQGRWDKAFSDSSGKAADVLAKMDEMLSNTERITNIIAEKGLVSGYQKQAEEESAASRRWRVLTVILGVGAVIFLAIAAFHPGAGSEGWVATAAKAGASLALGTLAYFTARVGTRHYARAVHYRSRELALATFRPYLEQLPVTERTQLIAKMAPDFFKELQENSSESDWQPQATGILEKTAADLLARYSGRA